MWPLPSKEKIIMKKYLIAGVIIAQMIAIGLLFVINNNPIMPVRANNPIETFQDGKHSLPSLDYYVLPGITGNDQKFLNKDHYERELKSVTNPSVATTPFFYKNNFFNFSSKIFFDNNYNFVTTSDEWTVDTVNDKGVVRIAAVAFSFNEKYFALYDEDKTKFDSEYNELLNQKFSNINYRSIFDLRDFEDINSLPFSTYAGFSDSFTIGAYGNLFIDFRAKGSLTRLTVAGNISTDYSGFVQTRFPSEPWNKFYTVKLADNISFNNSIEFDIYIANGTNKNNQVLRKSGQFTSSVADNDELLFHDATSSKILIKPLFPNALIQLNNQIISGRNSYKINSLSNDANGFFEIDVPNKNNRFEIASFNLINRTFIFFDFTTRASFDDLSLPLNITMTINESTRVCKLTIGTPNYRFDNDLVIQSLEISYIKEYSSLENVESTRLSRDDAKPNSNLISTSRHEYFFDKQGFYELRIVHNGNNVVQRKGLNSALECKFAPIKGNFKRELGVSPLPYKSESIIGNIPSPNQALNNFSLFNFAKESIEFSHPYTSSNIFLSINRIDSPIGKDASSDYETVVSDGTQNYYKFSPLENQSEQLFVIDLFELIDQQIQEQIRYLLVIDNKKPGIYFSQDSEFLSKLEQPIWESFNYETMFEEAHSDSIYIFANHLYYPPTSNSVKIDGNYIIISAETQYVEYSFNTQARKQIIIELTDWAGNTSTFTYIKKVNSRDMDSFITNALLALILIVSVVLLGFPLLFLSIIKKHP